MALRPQNTAVFASKTLRNGVIFIYHNGTSFTNLVQPRLRNHALDYSGTGGAAESPHTGRTSFFSKISSRFSKR